MAAWFYGQFNDVAAPLAYAFPTDLLLFPVTPTTYWRPETVRGVICVLRRKIDGHIHGLQ